MKITYDEKQDRGECVAFVSKRGNLVLKNTDTGRFTIAICEDGCGHNESCAKIEDARHKFYPGDKITITF